MLAVGGTATFSISASGTFPLSYRWRINNSTIMVNIITNNNTCLFTTNNVYSNAFVNVAITNIAGAAVGGLSSSASLYVMAPPSNQTVNAGADVTFSVVPQGVVPVLRYQWQFNSSDLLNATNATLTLTNVQPAAQGN